MRLVVSKEHAARIIYTFRAKLLPYPTLAEYTVALNQSFAVHGVDLPTFNGNTAQAVVERLIKKSKIDLT